MIDARKVILAVLLFAVSSVANAQETEADHIVARTEIDGGKWRYDFHYTTVDIDVVTPIVLSAAIFMSPEVYSGGQEAKGCAILNHYSIMSEADAPTSVKEQMTMESMLANAHYFIIESDGIGFGLTKDRKQGYLLGRVTAKNDIDAFLAGQKLLKEEGFKFGDIVVNLGYSQGGHTGMWVNKLVEEGYRSTELPKIDYSILGGGPYDIYSHYCQLIETGVSYYPVALPLILNGLIAEGIANVTEQDLFVEGLIAKMPEWFDSKAYTTVEINDSIYKYFGGSLDEGIPLKNIVTEAFLDSTSEVMQRLIPRMKEHSLVYGDWMPNHTDTIDLIHSVDDEVVPVINLKKMIAYLEKGGYNNLKVDTITNVKHTDTGSYYALVAMASIYSYVPTGISTPHASEKASDEAIFRIDGRRIRLNGTLKETLRGLAPGLYIVGKKKVLVK